MGNKETGDTELNALLQHMSPELISGEYVFLCFEGALYGDYPELQPIAAFREREGLTLVVPKRHADDASHTYESVFRCITLQVHSSLEAVGLTAAFATQLTRYGISANVIAGFYHDHIFVGEDDALEAMTALRELSGSA